MKKTTIIYSILGVIILCTILVILKTNFSSVLIDDEQVALGEFMYEVKKDTASNAKLFLNNDLSVDDKIYYLDAPTILSIVETGNLNGNGYIRWDGWGTDDMLTGNLKVSYFKDKIYTSMKLPSEVQTYMSFRKRPKILNYKPSGYTSAVGIGAIYPVTGATLPDNFNICFGKFKTFVLMEGQNEQWKVLDSQTPLNSTYNYRLYKLPWTLNKSFALSRNSFTVGSDYVKISLTKEDLNSQVLHFWGVKKPCPSDNVVGMVTIYEVWSDTPDIFGKLSASIAIDQKADGKNTQQAFYSRNYAVTNSKRLVIGHNMPDDVYDWCVANGKSPQVCLDLFYQD